MIIRICKSQSEPRPCPAPVTLHERLAGPIFCPERSRQTAVRFRLMQLEPSGSFAERALC